VASEVTKRLRDRRLNVWEQCKELADRAATENRAFSAEEMGSWGVMNEELDNLDKQIKSALEAEQRSKDADAAFDRIGGIKPEFGAGAGAGGGAVQGERRDAINGELRAFLAGGQGAPRHYEIEPSANWKRRAMANEYRFGYGPGGSYEQRILETTSGSVGGDTVPTDFYDQLIAHLIAVSGVMQTGPTVLNTAGGETLQIPKTTSDSLAASAAQAGTIPSSDPAFGLTTLSAYKYGILLQVARELIDDTAVDLMGYLAMQAGRAIGNKFGSDLVTGTGSSVQPTGFMTSATVGVTGTTTGKSGAPQYADLVNLEYSVIAPYRQSRSCYWIAQDATIGGFRLITDAQSRPIWEPSMVLGSPDLLLGKPLVADPFMPATATGAKSVAFGDFSQFFVRMVGPVRFERSDDYLFGSDLVAFRCLLRGDGALVDLTGAIKQYQGPIT
jgi:HK97 family phage major capsid protein